jgi:glucokinase
VADIGGTNARFARAEISADGAVTLGDPAVFATGDFPDLPSAWRAFLDSQTTGFEPEGAALALAGPAGAGPFKLTNANWHFDPAAIPVALGLERVTLLNDFAAVAHTVAGAANGQWLTCLAGPDGPLPKRGTITVIGPGTGLGIAHFRWHGGTALIQATEGAHIDFAPVCAIDDAVLAALRCDYPRVSLERVISGDGIAPIYRAIAALEGHEPELHDALSIWKSGMADGSGHNSGSGGVSGGGGGSGGGGVIGGSDPVAVKAVTHFVRTLGRVAGDYALAHGASGVVMAGGLGLRLQSHLAQPAFHTAFINKGRYAAMMEAMPIKLITHPHAGLLGAASAYHQEFCL